MSTPALVLVPGGAPAPASPAGAEVQALPPARSLSLYELEETLIAYGDSVDLVAEGDQQQFLADFQAALLAAAEKRDRVGWFLAHLDSQAQLADQEIKRLQNRKAAFERTHERIEAYLIHVIKNLGQDAKGKFKKLEGNTVTFSIKKCPDSVQLLDEEKIPSAFKSATVTMPLDIWNELVDALPIDRAAEIDDAIRKPVISVRKSDVKAAMLTDTPVPGARFNEIKYSLGVVK